MSSTSPAAIARTYLRLGTGMPGVSLVMRGTVRHHLPTEGRGQRAKALRIWN